MPSVDGEVVLTLARLLDFHYPWKTDDLHSPDYRVVNEYLIKMALSFQNKHAHTDWSQVDFLDESSYYLVEYCKTYPFTWTDIEV